MSCRKCQSGGSARSAKGAHGGRPADCLGVASLARPLLPRRVLGMLGGWALLLAKRLPGPRGFTTGRGAGQAPQVDSREPGERASAATMARPAWPLALSFLGAGQDSRTGVLRQTIPFNASSRCLNAPFHRPCYRNDTITMELANVSLGRPRVCRSP